MREDLLGYLLGALDGVERERVERQIESNPALEREISSLQAQLDPLREKSPDFEPPLGLATRTCAFVEQHCAQAEAEAQAEDHQVVLNESPVQLNSRHSVRWYDLFVGACVVLVGVALLFPAVVRSRYMAQRVACEKNLQNVAYALHTYSERYGGYFPAVPLEGNRSFAGVFAPMLVEDEYLTEANSFVCPSSSLAANDVQWQMPTLVSIDRASGRDLVQLRQVASGSYGYNLGVGFDGKYHSPKNQQREYFALVADSPTIHLPDRRSMNHGNQGQNVLYEDGHTDFVCGLLEAHYGDHPFLSRRGNVEPGLDLDDAVIGRSDTPPITFLGN